MRLTCTSTDRVTLLNVKYYINIILVTLLIIQCTLVAASPSPSSSSSPTTSSPSSTASSLSPDSKKINLNSNKSKIPVVSQVTSSKSPSSSVIPGPPHHTFSASQVSPSHSPSNQIQDSVIKVAGQLLASEPSSTPPPTAYYDKSFPSCTLGWESNPSLVHYDLISGHYLIDTPYRVTDDLEPSNCLRDCTRDPDCKSLNIDYKRGTCEFIQARVRESPLIDQTRLPTQYNLVQRNNLRASLGQNYFEKICLQNASLCSTKDWSFERIKSAKFSSFIFNNTSTGKYLNYNLTIIESINSREICLSLCINENRFICRAAIYDTNGKICWLSSINRFSSPDIKLERALNYEYYESNCVSEARGFCNTKGAKDQKQLLSERILFTSTLDECQSECIASSTSGVNVPSLPLHTTGQVSSVNVTHDTLDSSSGQAQATSGVQKPSESMYHLNSNNILHHPSKPTISLPSPSTTGFICRSFSYEASSHTCSLSHHSSRTSVQSLIRSPGYVYFELASCFDVQVDCNPESMVISVRSSNVFNGKLYPRDRATESTCALDITGSNDFSLSLPLTNSTCGTVQESEGEFTNVLVIQAHDAIVTSFDKAIGVKCTFEVGNRTVGQTNLTINEIPFEKKVKSKASLPPVTLHITDRMGREKDSFTLGEMLKVQVKLANESVYGIFVRNIVASNGQRDKVTLIDRHGCPSEGKLMKEVRLLDETSKSLESSFEAFSFTGSNYLTLQAEVETCLDLCKPVHCNSFARFDDDDGESVNDSNGTISYGRRRRSLDHRSNRQQHSKVDNSLSSSLIFSSSSSFTRSKRGVPSTHHRPGDVLAVQKVAKQIRLMQPSADESASSLENIIPMKGANNLHSSSETRHSTLSKSNHLPQSTVAFVSSFGSLTWILFIIGLIALFLLQLTCGFVLCTLNSHQATNSVTNSTDTWTSDINCMSDGTISNRSVTSSTSIISSSVSDCSYITRDKAICTVGGDLVSSFNVTGEQIHPMRGKKCFLVDTISSTGHDRNNYNNTRQLMNDERFTVHPENYFKYSWQKKCVDKYSH